MKKHAARALIVAIEHYPSFKNEMADLPGLAEQGQKLADWVKSAFPTAEISLQLGVKGGLPPTIGSIDAVLKQWFEPQLEWTERFFFFFLGHGVRLDGTVDLLVLGDFSSVMDSPQSLLPIDELTPLNRAMCGEQFFFLNCCRNNLSLTSNQRAAVGRLSLSLATAAAPRTARQCFLRPVPPGQTAPATADFTRVLLDGLSGKGEAKCWDGDKLVVYYDRLARYVDARLGGAPDADAKVDEPILVRALEPPPLATCNLILSDTTAPTAELACLPYRDSAAADPEYVKLDLTNGKATCYLLPDRYRIYLDGKPYHSNNYKIDLFGNEEVTVNISKSPLRELNAQRHSIEPLIGVYGLRALRGKPFAEKIPRFAENVRARFEKWQRRESVKEEIPIRFSHFPQVSSVHLCIDALERGRSKSRQPLSEVRGMKLVPGSYFAILEEGGRAVQKLPFTIDKLATEVKLELSAPIEPLARELWRTHQKQFGWVRFLSGPVTADQDLSLWLALFAGELWVKDRLPPPIGDETSAAHTEAVFLVATKETAALRMLSGLDIELHPVDALPDLRCGVARLPVGAQLWGISTCRGARYFPLYLVPGRVSFVVVSELPGKDRALRMLSLPRTQVTAAAILATVQSILAHERGQVIAATAPDLVAAEPVLALLRACQLRRERRTDELAVLVTELSALYPDLPDLGWLMNKRPKGVPLMREFAADARPEGLPTVARLEWQGPWTCWLTDRLLPSVERRVR